MDAWQFIVLLGTLILVYSYLLPNSSIRHVQADLMKEMEQSFEHFVDEFEEENQELVKLISAMKREHELQTSKLSGRIEALENQLQQVQQLQLSHNAKSAVNVQQRSPDPARPVIESIRIHAAENEGSNKASDLLSPQLNMKTRYKEIFDFHTHGKSMEYIAKKLGMNKGEIQLIIQLARQEEQFRV